MPDAYEHLRKYPLNIVLAALGFETFKYRKAGTEGYGACPIHGSKKNTTCFSFDDDGKWNCFSCNAHGRGSIDLVKAIKQCGFKDAVAFLEGITATIPAKTTQRPAKEESAPLTENPPFKSTYGKYAVPSPWLAARGLTEETLKRFGVFCYSNPARKSAYTGKIMIPIHRFKDGELVAYLARDTRPAEERGEDPKYIFPKGFAKQLELFGICQLKEKTHRVLYLLESPFAVMAFHQHGLAAVSPFGFSVSPEQVAIIAQLAKGVVYLCDRNKRDQIAGYIEALSRFVWVKAPALPDGVEDPECLTRSQIEALT